MKKGDILTKAELLAIARKGGQVWAECYWPLNTDSHPVDQYEDFYSGPSTIERLERDSILEPFYFHGSREFVRIGEKHEDAEIPSGEDAHVWETYGDDIAYEYDDLGEKADYRDSGMRHAFYRLLDDNGEVCENGSADTTEIYLRMGPGLSGETVMNLINQLRKDDMPGFKSCANRLEELLKEAGNEN